MNRKNKPNRLLALILVAITAFMLMLPTTALAADKPTVITGGHSDLTTTGATFSGSLVDTDPASVTDYGFFVRNSSDMTGSYFSAKDAGVALGADGTFSLTIDTLTPDTHYYYRAYIKYPGALGGVAYGARGEFNTLSETPDPAAPTITTVAADPIGTDFAELKGTAVDGDEASITETGFVVRKKAPGEQFGSVLPVGNAAGNFTYRVTGLDPNTTYEYKAVGKAGATDLEGSVLEFTTKSASTTVTTKDAENVGTTTATIKGEGFNGTNATIRSAGFFLRKSGDAYGDFIPAGTSAGAFSKDLTGLSAGTKYYFTAAVKVQGSSQYILGEEKSFTTTAASATVTTKEAQDVGTTTATIRGEGINGSATIVSAGFFVRKDGASYGSFTSAGTSAGSFSKNLTDLTPNTKYYFKAAVRVQGSNEYILGEEKSFTTSSTGDPVVRTKDETILSGSSVKLNGVFTAGTFSVKEYGFEYKKVGASSYTRYEVVSNTNGAFSLYMYDMSNGDYQYRAYAKTSDNVYHYGDVVRFEINGNSSGGEFEYPDEINVITRAANVTGYDSAILNGQVQSYYNNILNTGFMIREANKSYGNVIWIGNNQSTFSYLIEGLKPNTTYFFRAVALAPVSTNSYVTTNYLGDEKSFTTSSAPAYTPTPVVTPTPTYNNGGGNGGNGGSIPKTGTVNFVLPALLLLGLGATLFAMAKTRKSVKD